MDQTPPPFFKQGPSANARLAFFSLLAITLLVLDSRINALATLRQGVATVLYPIQKVLLIPRDWFSSASDYFTEVVELQNQNRRLKADELANAATLLRVDQLAAENFELRRLLGLRDRIAVNALMSQVLYEARDPFVKRFVLDRGSREGVLAGQPVIDADGVVGQITRVFPVSSEVTVITDQSLTIPVQIVRTGMRAIAYGGGPDDSLELRYLASNADVKEDDVVVTSGLDGLYPAGLPVGKVIKAGSSAGGSFVPALIKPAGGVKRSQTLAVLLVDKSRLPPPPPEVVAPRRKRRE